MKAVGFELADQNGEVQKLVYYHGKWVVLYFYPQDDTPGCTKEACAFRDSFHQLEAMGVMILGVSADSVLSHAKFAGKYNLNFPLLSDPTGEICKAYGAWKSVHVPGVSQVLRKTFLINPKGEIVKEYPKVNPLNHAQEIIQDLKKLGVQT